MPSCQSCQAAGTRNLAVIAGACRFSSFFPQIIFSSQPSESLGRRFQTAHGSFVLLSGVLMSSKPLPEHQEAPSAFRGGRYALSVRTSDHGRNCSRPKPYARSKSRRASFLHVTGQAKTSGPEKCMLTRPRSKSPLRTASCSTYNWPTPNTLIL